MQAYFKQPDASSIRDVYTSAFSIQLWILLLTLWLFICLSMHLAYRVYFKRDGLKPKEINWKDELMSDEVSIWAAGAMCQQGFNIIVSLF
jgi:hypothetical protein